MNNLSIAETIWPQFSRSRPSVRAERERIIRDLVIVAPLVRQFPIQEILETAARPNRSLEQAALSRAKADVE